MGDESKQITPGDPGNSGDNSKKETLFNELDSLRYTLNSGPEFQQDIPTLNEPVAAPLEQCDLFRDSDGLIHDPDLDIPILTDTYEQPDSPEEPEQSATLPETDDTVADESTATSAEHQQFYQQDIPDQDLPDQALPDVAQLQEETDSSVQELEQVLDELVAEQLPKLEQQLREKLRRELESK